MTNRIYKEITNPIGSDGKKGPIGVCQRCKGTNIDYDIISDTNLCKDCGWPGRERRKINILGTEYTIEDVGRGEDTRLNENDGICDDSVKEIILARIERDSYSKRDLDIVRKKVLRHEIVHAFLCESGLSCNSEWAENEELVDWIALQGPKIWKVWQEAGAV